jgi:hypothetical protein
MSENTAENIAEDGNHRQPIVLNVSSSLAKVARDVQDEAYLRKLIERVVSESHLGASLLTNGAAEGRLCLICVDGVADVTLKAPRCGDDRNGE